MEHYAYYTLRVQYTRPADAPPGLSAAELSGVVERLDTGEKHGFANGQELLQLVGGWTGGPNMHAGAERGNEGSVGPDAAGGAAR